MFLLKSINTLIFHRKQKQICQEIIETTDCINIVSFVPLLESIKTIEKFPNYKTLSFFDFNE